MSTTPPFLDMFRLDSYYTIVSAICSLLQIGDIIALTRTCKALSTLYKGLLPSQWNVDRYLSRFVSDPRRFRSLMSKNEALVSGPLALRFFERADWNASNNLDIFARGGKNADAFNTYLTQVEGYHSSQSHLPQFFSLFEIIKIHTYKRPYGAESPGNDRIPYLVKVISTTENPLYVVLAGRPSQVPVNFFTSSKAYALYPSLTFLQPGGILSQPLGQYIDPFMIQQGGLEGAIGGTDWSSSPGLTTRRIGDRFTWTIEFDMRGVRWPGTPDPALEYPTSGIDIYVEKTFSIWRIHAPYQRLHLAPLGRRYGRYWTPGIPVPESPPLSDSRNRKSLASLHSI